MKSPPAFSRILIAGKGAIGCLLAAGAVRASLPYCLFPRKLPAHPIEVFSSGKTWKLTHFSIQPVTTRCDDVLIVPVKVYQVSDVVRQWAAYLHPKTPVVLLHNGMGGYEAAMQYLDVNQPVFCATTSHGALKETSNKVLHTGSGDMQVGSLCSDAPANWLIKRVTATLSALLGPASWQADMKMALWRKLAVNAVINPLTALNNVKNGDILKPGFTEEVEKLCQETTLIAESAGIHLNAGELVSLVQSVAANTADNYSSMHQDFHHHRRTEIDGINGYLASLAKKRGIDAPRHASLTEQILANG